MTGTQRFGVAFFQVFCCFHSDDPLSEPHVVQVWVGDQVSGKSCFGKLKESCCSEIYCFLQFLTIVKNKSLPKSSCSLLNITKLLLCHAHYSPSSSEELHVAAVEPQVQRSCCTRLMGVLAELCTLISPTNPTKRGDTMPILFHCTCKHIGVH